MNSEFKILLVDDEKKYRDVLSKILTSNHYYVETASTVLEAINMVKKNNYHLILTDLVMPEIDGLELLSFVKNYNPNLEVIIITGYGSIDNAVNAMKKGAFSYYIKSKNTEELLAEIEKVVEMKDLLKDNQMINHYGINSSFVLESENSEFKNILQIAKKAARSNANILIEGEAGVGKSVLARYIHKNSLRSENEFVNINCHTHANDLLALDFFGHEQINKEKSFREATLYLDEIHELSFESQIQLLKTIENKKESADQKAKKFRLVTSSQRALNDLVQENKFRKDLFYKISTINLQIPPLRERKEDLPKLINFLINGLAEDQGKKIDKIENDVMAFLLKYDYPGNIRELKNIIERLVVLSDNGIIDNKYINLNKEVLNNKYNKDFTLKEFRQMKEKEYIKRVLKITDHNISKAAKMLDISRRQLYNKINDYNI